MAKTILVVDDDPLVLRLTEMILNNADYRCIPVVSTSAALAILENKGHQVDLLLTDVVMPMMNGVVLAQKVASLRPGLKILLMTSHTQDALREMNLIPEGTQLIIKPFTPLALMQRLEALLA